VKFSTVVSRSGHSEEPVDISSTSKSTGVNVDGGIALYFDLKILGTRGNAPVLEIAGKIEALYELSDEEKPTPEQIKAFAKSNGMLNIWPYWREYIQSATQRVGFAPLTLPLFRVVHSGSTKGK
jgi:hypothetical protein